jgi:energy-coupling factor transport system substrate-specific component
MTAPTTTLARTTTRTNASAIRFDARSAVTLALASFAGAIAFAWPLLLPPSANVGHGSDAPLVFLLLLPILVVVVLAGIAGGGIDSKALAMLGVLSAIGAALRPLGAGTAGIETTFFLLILAGRVFGPGFGFVLGSTTLFASALITGGVGPWLPFQMLAASWVGLGAGLLPPMRGRAEVLLLAAYTGFAAMAFGLLMNLWFWPFVLGDGSSISYVPGAPLVENLTRLLLYSLATSMGWDVMRAVTNVVLILLLGPAVLAVLRRTARRAAFGRATIIPTTATSPVEPSAIG